MCEERVSSRFIGLARDSSAWILFSVNFVRYKMLGVSLSVTDAICLGSRTSTNPAQTSSVSTGLVSITIISSYGNVGLQNGSSINVSLRNWYVPRVSIHSHYTYRTWQNLEKIIPDSPANQTPVHLKKRQIYAHQRLLGNGPADLELAKKEGKQKYILLRGMEFNCTSF